VQMALAAIDRGAFSRQPVGVAQAGVRGRGTPGPQARHVNGRPIDKCSLSDVVPRKVRFARPGSLHCAELPPSVLLLDLADDYDKLADRALERASRDGTSGPSPIPKNG
jgi:hypothetical protein